MRTILLLWCLAFLGGTTNLALAQNAPKQKPTAEEMATKRTAKLTELLTLDANQQIQLKELMLVQGKKKETINNTPLTQAERQAKMKELRTAFDAELKKILNAEQYEKYQAHKAEHKKHSQQKRPKK